MAVRAAPIAMSAKASPALSSVKSITAPVRSSKTAMMRRNRSRDPVNVVCLLPAFDATAYLTAATSGPAPIGLSVKTGRSLALPAEQPGDDGAEKLARRPLAVIERRWHEVKRTQPAPRSRAARLRRQRLPRELPAHHGCSRFCRRPAGSRFALDQKAFAEHLARCQRSQLISWRAASSISTRRTSSSVSGWSSATPRLARNGLR